MEALKSLPGRRRLIQEIYQHGLCGTHTIADLFIDLQQIARLSNRCLYGRQEGSALAIVLSNGVPLSGLSRLCSSLCDLGKGGVTAFLWKVHRTPAI